MGVFAAACYTDGGYNNRNPYYNEPNYNQPSYNDPSYSAGIVTHAPEAPYYSEDVWYYGVHPRPSGHHLGAFCSNHGAHSHGAHLRWSNC